MKTHSAGASKIKKVVTTRSSEGNIELAGRLSELGFEPVSIDTIEFLPPEDWSTVDASLLSLNEFDWLLFTSATGVEFFTERMRALSLAIPWRGKPAVAAVGEKTSAALQREGVEVEFVPSRYMTKALAEELPRDRGKSLLMLRADIGDPDALAALEREGFKARDLTIYRTSPVARGEGEAADSSLIDADAVVFASPSAVEAFFERLDSSTGSALAERLLAVCIGPVTAKVARERGVARIVTPRAHTIDGLLESLCDAAHREGGS
jgi:uroporphyrinogen-III synthase